MEDDIEGMMGEAEQIIIENHIEGDEEGEDDLDQFDEDEEEAL
jgi:hypothetical protein